MKYLYSVLTLLFLTTAFIPVYAQDKPDKEKIRKKLLDKNPELQKEAEEDTTRKLPFGKRDTLKTIEVESRLFWFDAFNSMRERNENISDAFFSEKEEKQYAYTDISDIFRNRVLWFDYDLRELIRPAYIAGINRYPHQTSVFFNGVVMNDPIHGMFNGQFIPFNYVRQIQTLPGFPAAQSLGFGGGSSLNFISNIKHSKAPWTKLVFKEGSYGFSDFDASFVKPINPDFAFQLGGMLKEQDGAYPNNTAFSQYVNYRGEVTWQYNPNLFIRSQFYLSRFKAGLAKPALYDFTQYPRQSENRDDYFLDITWLPDDSLNQRLHLQLYNTFSRRRLKNIFFSTPAYNSSYTFNRYGFDANYNVFFSRFELITGAGGNYNIIKGKVFPQKHYLYTVNTYAQLNFPVNNKIQTKSVYQFILNEKNEPGFIPALHIDFLLSEKDILSLNASRGVRFANATEKYFDYDSLYGNPNLIPEEHLSLYAKYKTQLINDLQLEADAGYSFIADEIVWNEEIFSNGPDRDFAMLGLNLSYPVWKFQIKPGGFYMFSNVKLTAGNGAWLKLHYHDYWFKQALGVDLYGTAQYTGAHRKIQYDPRLERFYLALGESDSYVIYNWKAVATVKTARIYFEMDNAFSNQYEVIAGNPDLIQRWRFGVHWIFWD